MIENSKGHRIRGATLSLTGLEYALAHNKDLLTKKLHPIELTTAMDKYDTDVKWKEGISVPFKIDLPTRIKRSFVGKFSRYLWVLDANLNILGGRDFHVKTEIQVI
jgi:hypothetical protein